MTGPLLHVDAVTVDVGVRDGRGRARNGLRVLDDVTLRVPRGRTVGLIGESGSGKTTLGLTVLGVHVPATGRVVFDGTDLATLRRKHRQPFRQQVQMVFQDPGSALDPRMTLRQIVGEPMLVHGLSRSRRERADRAAALLHRCGVPAALTDNRPHVLSGGLRQRVAIARALAAEPGLLIADEPTSALDVSVQSQILRLLRDLQDEHGIAMLFVSHDLGVVRHVAHEVAVLHRGQVVEAGPASSVFDAPQHPYTRGLLASSVLPVRQRRPEHASNGAAPPACQS